MIGAFTTVGSDTRIGNRVELGVGVRVQPGIKLLEGEHVPDSWIIDRETLNELRRSTNRKRLQRPKETAGPSDGLGPKESPAAG